MVRGLDPRRVDPAEGAANVADDVLQLRREQDVGRDVVRHARAYLAANVAAQSTFQAIGYGLKR